MKELIYLILITFLPFLELRASIPFGILQTDYHWSTVFLICVITNIILGIIIYICLDKFIHIATKIKLIDKIYKKCVEKTQKKIKKAVEKWGEPAIAVFIGIPLPGSGVYTGALGAYLIGLNFKKFVIANIVGVLIAGIIVTIVSLTGAQALQFLIKMI